MADEQLSIKQGVTCLRQGGVIAYPTEAVFGFGCDPFNASAVARILQLKHRLLEKGFILIAADWKQVEQLTQPIPPDLLTHALETWPGPYTWVFPASDLVPHWITGNHKSVAIRVTAHPIASALCTEFGGPIVSTSANYSGTEPTRDYRATLLSFKSDIDFVVEGSVGAKHKPTTIRDVLTGEILRSG